MATYPIKMLKDENGQAFVPLTSLDAVMGEKNLQYILDAAQVSPGHFRVNYKDLKMKDLVNSIIVIRWPEITSTVKPSYLQLNTETEVILYNGTGTEYLDLEEASGTVNMLAYDGEKWILTSGAGSGSGHVITDDEGHTMEQQKILNFVGFNVENDTANRATKIINPTPINNLTTTESGQGSLDAYQGNILFKRSVPTGGIKGQVLAKSGNGDHQLEWINQDSDDVITSNGSIEEAVSLTYSEYKDMEAAGTLSAKTMYYINDMDNIQWTTLSAAEIDEIVDNNQSKLSINGGTLQGNLTLQTTYPTIILQSKNLEYNVAPAHTEYPCVLWTDKNNNPMGRLEMIADSGGARYMSLYAIIPGSTVSGSFLQVGWDASGNPKSRIDGDFTVGKGLAVTNSVNIGGSITVGSGFGKKYTFTKTLTPTTDWIDTGINGSVLPSGAYILHMTGCWDTNMSWQADAQYVGMIAWYSGDTNSNDRSDIVLHRAGHAFNGYEISLSTRCYSRSLGVHNTLQIKSNIAFTRATDITFTFVKIV